MGVFVWNALEIPVDEDGFIQKPELWNKELALALAATDGVQD
jgi:sulfur relay (sulfurtransferase) DsrC/TusE family protein